MDGLVEYSIPVTGLRNGIHQFDFQIGRSFFRHFEHSPVADGSISMHLEFEKRPDMYVLHFEFEGTVKTECDRCLAAIDLPISGQNRLLVKFSFEEESEEAEVVYVSPEVKKLDVSSYIYEFIVLSIPMIKVYDCRSEEDAPCNEEMLKYLNGEDQENKEKDDDGFNPIWEELKKLSKDN